MALVAAVAVGGGEAAGQAAAVAPAAPAQPEAASSEPGAPAVTASPPLVPRIAIHGYVSEGAYVSTSTVNDYFGTSQRAGLDQFEAALNFSTEVTDRLRVGTQLFARNLGSLRDVSPRIDWAYLDYRWRQWAGLRAGIIKMPFGLYNEYVDTDAARLPILMPESVYPIHERDVFLSHTGFAIYGNRALGGAGELDYQAWLGTLTIPRNALQIIGGTLDAVNTKYVTGAQAFWSPPVAGLRVGATYLRTSIDFHLTLGPALTSAVIMAGLAPPGYDGKLVISQRPSTFVVGSAEYTRGDWVLAAEYSRWRKHQRSTLAALSPTIDDDREKLYGMVTYRAAPQVEIGGYYSLYHVDVGDRRGDDPRFAEPFHAFQRDLAATIRFDVNEHWLWKLEGHFMDGTASLSAEFNAEPERYWGLFLLRTTVTF
jgi:hypothetical protein